MTNTKVLQGKMRENGYTLKSLSKFIGLSSTTLFNKVHGKKEFLISEVRALRTALDLSDADVQEIFFTNDVELKSTN